MKTKEISKSVKDSDEQSVLLSRGIALAHKEVVYTKTFRGGLSIYLRPFCISRDMPFVVSRIKKKSGGINFIDLPLHLIAATYLNMQASSFARAFICLINNRIPIDVIEISDMRYSELSLCDGIEHGDFSITIPFDDGAKELNLVRALGLQTCLEYFFSFSEVKRIVCTPNVVDKDINKLLIKSGFGYTSKLAMRNGLSNFYCCTRETFTSK